MADPNSPLSRFRRALVKLIEPRAGVKEAWCIECVLNEGQTAVLPVENMMSHVEMHKQDPGKIISLDIGDGSKL